MKTIVKALAVVIAMGFFISAPQKAKAQVAVSFQVFYDGLSPYGQWVESPDYGYVWVPSVGGGFTPYATAGHWVYTSYGWTWVSDYSWGWAPFHYGRWAYDDGYGWVWIPGEDWGPAWVSWRMCDGFYGWAPLGPSFGVWYNYSPPAGYWRFVACGHFTDYHVYNYYAPRSNNATYIKQSTTINITGRNGGVSYYTGPAKANVEKASGHSVTQYSVNARSKPGQEVGNNAVSIYRPSVTARGSGGSKPVPAKVTPYKQASKSTVNTNSSHARSSQPVTTPQRTTERPMTTNTSRQNRAENNVRVTQQPNNRSYRQAAPVHQTNNRMPPQPQFRGGPPAPIQHQAYRQENNGRHR